MNRVVFPKPDLRKVLSAEINLGEHVLVACHFAPWINVAHHAVYLKIGDHLFDIIRHDQCMRFTWRLIDVATFLSDPVVLQIMPAPFQNKTVDGLRVAVTR